MTTIHRSGVSLSAGAVLNGWPMPAHVVLTPGAGDYAERIEGRDRRRVRRQVRAAKSAWLEG